MNRVRLLSMWRLLLIVVGVVGWNTIQAAEPSSRLLRGEFWRTMSLDTKVAYVWGIGNLVEFERALRGTAEPDSKSFLPLLVKGLQGRPINEVVRRIDSYYEAHPDQLQRPVLDTIFQVMVVPTLRGE